MSFSLGACDEAPAVSSPPVGSSGSAGQATVNGGASNSGGDASSSSAAGGTGVAGSGGSGGSPSAVGGGGSSGASGTAGGGTGTGCAGKTICWDFEEGEIPAGWTQHFDSPKSPLGGELLVDSTKPFGTSKFSLHAKNLVGARPQKSIVYNLPAGFGPVLWGRARMYISPTRPESHAGFFSAYYQPLGSNSTAMNTLDWYEVGSYAQAYMSIWHTPFPPGVPESVRTSDTKLALDQWACVEWHFDGKNDVDTQAARPRVWLDGAELAMKNHDDDVVRAKATSFRVVETGVTMWKEMPTPNSWWIDDLAVGPDRVGCN